MNAFTQAHIAKLDALSTNGDVTKKQILAFANTLLKDEAITAEQHAAIKGCQGGDCLEMISALIMAGKINEAPAEEIHPEYAAAMETMPADTTPAEPDLDAEWAKMEAEKAAANPPAKTGARVNKSSIESPCLTVWNLADSMPGATRKEVCQAAEAKGVAHYTAKTQYQAWFKAQKASVGPADPAPAAE